MMILSRVFRGAVFALSRGAFLYVCAYLYIFVLIPLLVAFDAWAPVPLWVCLGIYSVVTFIFELYRLWPEQRLEPVQLGGSRGFAEDRRRPERSFRRGRTGYAGSSAGGRRLAHCPLHRQVRFGRTRLR